MTIWGQSPQELQYQEDRVSEKRYVVPEGMLKAARNSFELGKVMLTDGDVLGLGIVLEAALKWQAENPRVPTGEEGERLWNDGHMRGPDFRRFVLTEWQRRMYLAPEDDFERDCKDLTVKTDREAYFIPEIVNDRLREAYERGKRSK